jgi:hypothetical protein
VSLKDHSTLLVNSLLKTAHLVEDLEKTVHIFELSKKGSDTVDDLAALSSSKSTLRQPQDTKSTLSDG